MIKVEQTKTPQKGYVRYQIYLDDEIFRERDYKRPDRRLFFSYTFPDELDVTLCDKDLIERVGEHTFTQIPKQIKIMRFDVENVFSFDCILIRPDNHFSITQDEDGFVLYWLLETVSENWATPFSRAEFLIELYRKLIRHYKIKIYEDSEPTDSANNAMSVTCHVNDPDSTIAAEISTHRTKIQKILDQSVAHIMQTYDRESLAVFFDFPEPIRIACEQYLLYFGQFLNDLGVSANTALTHESGQVLFTVTPNNREEALENIRQALSLYLELPSSPISDSTNESIEVQRLESSVLRLRSDLRLAAAELQAKEATIKAQNLMIGILNGHVLVDSVKEVLPRAEDKEDVIPGIVSLSTYKDKGVELNLGEMFRRLKRFFRED